MDLYGELEWRGLVYDATEGLRDLIAREKLTTDSWERRAQGMLYPQQSVAATCSC